MNNNPYSYTDSHHLLLKNVFSAGQLSCADMNPVEFSCYYDLVALRFFNFSGGYFTLTPLGLGFLSSWNVGVK